MVKRWQGSGKMIVKVPWPFGTNVHRIDLTIKDLAVRWERSSVHVTVEIKRQIRYVTKTGELRTKTDLVCYQKELPTSPTLIQGQPLKAKATTLYLLVQDQGHASYLEQGIGLQFSGWERQPVVRLGPRVEKSLMILGKNLVAQDSYLHTETLIWPEVNRGDLQLQARLVQKKFLLTAQGVHFQGELELACVGKVRKNWPLSVLIPQQVPVGTELVGRATIRTIKALGEGKVLVAVDLAWFLLQEKPLQVQLAPTDEGEPFFLCRLAQQEIGTWVGNSGVKLPEKAKFITEVSVAGVQRQVVSKDKGVLCVGTIALDLFYVNEMDQEKCHRAIIPWQEWIGALSSADVPTSAEGSGKEYKISINTVKVEQLRFLEGNEVNLLVQLEYTLTVGQRQKAVLPFTDQARKTTTIFAEKLITEEPIEYYVEIPIVTPTDFRESHRLWWKNGAAGGIPADGGVIISAQPAVLWEYRDLGNKIKVVEVNPNLSWLHPSPLVRDNHRVRVKTEALRLQLHRNNRGEFRIELLLTGHLIATQEVIRTVSIGVMSDESSALPLPPPKSSILKWEEKLPFAVKQILTTHFFWGEFRRVNTEDFLLLEGEVRGELTYLGKDGTIRYYSLKKELWANLPPTYNKVPVVIPVLTGWKCYPLPQWNWEEGGVWCEIAINLLTFAVEQNYRQGGE